MSACTSPHTHAHTHAHTHTHTHRACSFFVCLGSAKGPNPPVFFYFGNEDNVELYVEHTGLMWESAPDMVRT